MPNYIASRLLAVPTANGRLRQPSPAHPVPPRRAFSAPAQAPQYLARSDIGYGTAATSNALAVAPKSSAPLLTSLPFKLQALAALPLAAALALAVLAHYAPVRAQESEPPAMEAPAQVLTTTPKANVAPKKAAAAPKSLGPWRKKLLTHINGHKRGFAGGAGVASISFKIDRSGKVLSTQVVKSSGNKALDAEATALTKRASPMPPPPSDVTGQTLLLTVPIRFSN